MNRINRALSVFILIFVFMLSGCVSKPSGPYSQTAEESSGDVIDESTEAADDPNREQNHPLSSIGILREMIEESNRLDEAAEQMGFHPLKTILFMSFTEDDEPYSPISTGIIPMNGGSLNVTVVMRIEDAENDGSSDFSATAVMLLNGQAVDFQMNEKNSEGGILTASLRSNQDYIMSVSAEDLPVVTGENELMLVVFNYCQARDLYLDCQSIAGHFVSEQDHIGTVTASCPENEIDIYTIREKTDMGRFSEMPFVSAGEMVDFQSDHYGNYLMTTKPDPTMHFYIDSSSFSESAGSHTGKMFLLIDGELQPAWNGKYFGDISYLDSDLMKVIRIGTSFQAGEQHHVYWCCQETQSSAEWPFRTYSRMKMKIS